MLLADARPVFMEVDASATRDVTVFSAAGGTDPTCLLSGLQPHEENLETVFERIVAGGTGGSADG